MAARSTSRFKQKPAVPFGDYMLPIIGVIAVGIVVVGVRILFWPNSTGKAVKIAQPRPAITQNNQTRSEENASEGKKTAESSALGTIKIAQPIHKKKVTGTYTSEITEKKGTTVVKEKAATQKNQTPVKVVKVTPQKTEVRKVEPVKSPAKAVSRNFNISPNKSAFIVQCGSFGDSATANGVAAKLQKKGYGVAVQKVVVRGKTFFRVIAGGGRDRVNAEEIANRIRDEGYSVMVRPKD